MMQSAPLHTPLAYLKGVGPGRARALERELGLKTFQDLLYFFPNRYIDKSRFYKIRELVDSGAEIQVVGTIVHLKTVAQKKGQRLVATFRDETGEMELVWFRSLKWFRERLKLGEPYVAFGRTNRYGSMFSMAHPELELLSAFRQQPRIHMQPVYASTEKLGQQGITNRLMGTWTANVLKLSGPGPSETLPAQILERLKLIGKRDALVQIHFPDSNELLARSMARLKFEELFYIQLMLLFRKQLRKQKIKGHPFDKVGDYLNNFYREHLPFELTNAQKRVVREIRSDMGSGAQMNRLLQGDVGSGKTMVAVLSMLLAMDNGYQACLVAPTEILARQHYQSVLELLKPMGIEAGLLTGSVKEKERKPILEALVEGTLPIIIGTHAVMEERVRFQNMGLAIIDEQHRFGVAQRARLWKKNQIPPHILIMTATPIPRTLAMSLYGDLDISLIDEMPPGRKPVRTVHRRDAGRLRVFRFLKEEIAKGRQVYVVYPLIQESEALDYKDLMDGYESISREFPQPEYQVSIVHGQMKPEAREIEMQRFIDGKTNIMVATTVIEVGVNIPNASVMVIESAERFGLSQLHQLRGRVGRGAEQSYCILMSGDKLSEDARTRLETMARTNDGFEIAETDLKLRGPGDLMGTQQSGILNLRIADLVQDRELMQEARACAIELLSEDPSLIAPEHRMIRDKLGRMEAFRARWDAIS